MSALIQGVSKIYGILLRLFPRDFQNEFKEEMEDVFTASLDDASKISATLVVRACIFELFDLPVNLVVEHLSTLRKGNVMKTTSFEVLRARIILMAALGMMAGWVLIKWINIQYFRNLREGIPWKVFLVETIPYTLPVLICGLLLGIAAGVGRHAFLRIGLYTAVGGILTSMVVYPVRMVSSEIWNQTRYLPTRETNLINLLLFLAIMCTIGFFYGAILGFAFGGWKICLKYALIGLVANAGGLLVGYFISSFLSSRVPLGNYGPSYIEYSIMGAIAGGILGWFFGKEKQPEADPVMRTGNA